jgi:hypothetical protein
MTCSAFAANLTGVEVQSTLMAAPPGKGQTSPTGRSPAWTFTTLIQRVRI